MKKIIFIITLTLSNLFICANKKDSALIHRINKLENQLNGINKECNTLNHKNDSLQSALNQIKMNDYKSFEVVEKVNSFYDGAWNKLIFLISAIGGIVVLVVPIILSKLQRRELKLNKEDFQEYVDKKIIEFDSTIKAHNDTKIVEFSSQLEIKLHKQIAGLYGMTFYLQAREYLLIKKYPVSINNFIKSIKKQIESEHIKNIPVSLENICLALNKMKIENQVISDKIKKELAAILDQLSEEYSSEYDEMITKVRYLIPD